MTITVVSGKGGTGKTTVVAAFSDLAAKTIPNLIRVDCDVDAPNLSLLSSGQLVEKRNFYGGKKARINKILCQSCEICEEVCHFGAITNSEIDSLLCEGCGACSIACPRNAINMHDEKTAETYLSKNEMGILSNAEMEVGSEGSGKLVTYLRKTVNRFETGNFLTIIDGSPGIGCAVIASITNTDIAVIVTEPTKSGLSDLERILELIKRFENKVYVCINKYDINEQMSEEIEAYLKRNNIRLMGRIPFDAKVSEAINKGIPITHMQNSRAAKEIQKIWNQFLTKELEEI